MTLLTKSHYPPDRRAESATAPSTLNHHLAESSVAQWGLGFEGQEPEALNPQPSLRFAI